MNLFDPTVGFFQGRDSAGDWRLDRRSYDPRVWGYDYTETNGWNMAFTVPQDSQGLANLYGGAVRARRRSWTTFFTTPETADFPGSYGGTHPRDDRGPRRPDGHVRPLQPAVAPRHLHVRLRRAALEDAGSRSARCCRRLYLGSEIGQGYHGDEDNGELSAWYLFSALGFYPLVMGSPAYAIGSPLFTKATVHLENGRELVVKAPKNSATNVYVQALKVNGKADDSTSLPHSLLADGAVLEFDMGPEPSAWGADSPPPSLTTGDAVAGPLRDLTGPGKGTASDPVLVDDTSTTRATLASGAWQYQFASGGEQATFYTLTSNATAGDPSAWRLRGSYDGTTWTTIDERRDQTFDWRLQTRPFKIATPGRYAYYRLEVTAGTAALAEVELLGHPAPACTTTIADTVRGDLTVRSGVTCLTAGATVTGSVTVKNGASLFSTGATLRAEVTATDAGTVSLLNTTVVGALKAVDSGPVGLENSTVRGAVTLRRNDTRTVVSGNRITGVLACSGNDPAPANNGLANTGTGREGQCAKL